MKYFSTRNKSLEYSFKDIFLRGLAPDGGLFLPSKIKRYNLSDLKNLSKLSYINLAVEIIYNFCKDDIERKDLNKEIVCLSSHDERTKKLLKYMQKMINKEDGEFLFKRTMSFCSSSDGWVINDDAAKLLNIANQEIVN